MSDMSFFFFCVYRYDCQPCLLSSRSRGFESAYSCRLEFVVHGQMSFSKRLV